MSLSSINGSSGVSSAGSSSIALLQKEAQSIQKQITQESKSSDDAKTKARVMMMLEVQLQQIEAQIQQIQAKAAQAATSSAKSTTTDTTAQQPAKPTSKIDKLA